MSLEVEFLSKRFGDFDALKGVSFSAKPGAFVALLGPSGSGKTTLLRILGGLEFADTGRVAYDNEDWLAKPARARRAGFVFQHYALFRHMTVEKNIGFGLNVRPRRQRPPRAEIARRVRDLLSLVQLDDLSLETLPVNLPGTSTEYPNWRRRLGRTLPELAEAIGRTGTLMAAAGRGRRSLP